jgi:predicted phage-related endonuclease
MIIHSCQPGTAEWDQLRLDHGGASEAAAMLGIHPTVRRDDLLAAKRTRIPKQYSEWVEAHLFAPGHETEARARELLEQDTGELFFPVVLSDGYPLASLDGITDGEWFGEICVDDQPSIMVGEPAPDQSGAVLFEHKLWNPGLAAMILTGMVPEYHMAQCQQELMVSGGRAVIFMSSDGTRANRAWVVIHPDPAWFERLRAGWMIFQRDLAVFVPKAEAEVVVPTVIERLPSVFVKLDGSLTVASNLGKLHDLLKGFVDKIPKKPSTDQEFVDVDAACKALGTLEDELRNAEHAALASIGDVEAMRRAVADILALSSSTRLACEKIVKNRKEAIRGEIVAEAQEELRRAVGVIEIELAPDHLPQIPADFAEAIKGKRTVATLKNAVDAVLVAAKVEAERLGALIKANAQVLAAHSEYRALFADRKALVLKPTADLIEIVGARVEAEKQRQADARARVEAETKARAETEARAKIEAEAKIKADAELASAAAQAPAVAGAGRSDSGLPVIGLVPNTGSQILSRSVGRAPSAPKGPPTLKLGDMAVRLGSGKTVWSVTAALLADLGIEPAATDKASKLYHQEDWQRICDILIDHIELAKGKTTP